MDCAQSAQQGRGSKHVTERGKLNYQNPLAERGIMRALVAFASETARLMPQEKAAVETNHHGSFSKISNRRNAAGAKPTAAKKIGRAESPI